MGTEVSKERTSYKFYSKFRRPQHCDVFGVVNPSVTPNVKCLGPVSLYVTSFFHQLTLFGFI
jgi:hypothetical protein